MTSLAAYLEDFGTPPDESSQLLISDETLETERLEAFDRGYRAGWDDAIKAKSDEGALLADGVAHSLQDLSFTYHEVHAQVMSNLTPLFNEILQKILPNLARDTLGAHIVDQLSQVARDIGTVQIGIEVAPGAAQQVTQLINGASTSLPVTVVESPSVVDGQAHMKLGAKELTIDLAEVCQQITEAVHAVLHDQAEMRAHG
ncbi:ABC transporter ATP-binding protein [Marivita sp.]|uniref:ABC transporter ATP-binding protein n=1 Tax=Marivita sp. TaxID=2003365 RepID=UPI0025C4A40E|nr:ABC transporter ATP-binding protein [Marivita sp.]